MKCQIVWKQSPWINETKRHFFIWVYQHVWSFWRIFSKDEYSSNLFMDHISDWNLIELIISNGIDHSESQNFERNIFWRWINSFSSILVAFTTVYKDDKIKTFPYKRSFVSILEIKYWLGMECVIRKLSSERKRQYCKLHLMYNLIDNTCPKEYEEMITGMQTHLM